MAEWRVIGTGPESGKKADATFPVRVWGDDGEAVGLTAFAWQVRRLLSHAAQKPQDRFLVDEEGLLGGFPLHARHYLEFFRIRPDNVITPRAWEERCPRVPAQGKMRLIIAGSRHFEDYAFLKRRMEQLCSKRDPTRIYGISGGATGADTLGERWFEESGIPFVRYDAHWDWVDAPRAVIWERNGRAYNKRAGMDRNARMAAAGTHLAAFVSDRALTPGTAAMVKVSGDLGLVIRLASPPEGRTTKAMAGEADRDQSPPGR